MPAPNDLEKRAVAILDNACWLQGIICSGCTSLFYDSAKFVGGELVLSEPRCLNPDCAGHEPVAAYQKALQALADYDVFPVAKLARYGLVQRREVADANTTE